MQDEVLLKDTPHTLAKLKILKRYLQAWMPILARRAAERGGRPLYVDGFAGPGEYESGAEGSPLVAVRAAMEHDVAFPVPIEMSFIEKEPERHEHLVTILRRRFEERPRNVILRPPILGEAEVEVRRILANRDPTLFIPTLVFLDQFGYKAVPMELIRQVLDSSSCETFSFMNWQRLNPYLTDETKAPTITRAFGGDEWREAASIPPGEGRQERFLTLYQEALKKRASTTFSWTFSMHGGGGELLYWLTFCSKSDRGLEEMKKAMWRVDPSGRYRFEDRYAGQRRIFQDYDRAWLANTIFEAYSGREVSVSEIRLFVLTETPCVAWGEALVVLEREGRLHVVGGEPGRRKGSFKKLLDDPDHLVRFRGSDFRPEEQIRLF